MCIRTLRSVRQAELAIRQLAANVGPGELRETENQVLECPHQRFFA